MGMGKSSGSSQAQLTPEQTQALQAQTNALTGTFLPAYQNTIGMANTAYGQSNPSSTAAANTASNVASQTGQLQQQVGTNAYQSGMGGQQNTAAYQQGLGQNLTGAGASSLAQLFSPQYEQQQVNAALEPAMEQTREAMGGQNASYGAAGGLGSSRAALAQANLQSLSNQRLGTVAAQTQQGIESNRAAASQALLGAGQNATGQAGSLYGNIANQGAAGLGSANQAASARIGYAQTPQDVLAKYASVIYGTPQASTTPNFAGTQGQASTSKGFGGGVKA